jgi:hypothetical protein
MVVVLLSGVAFADDAGLTGIGTMLPATKTGFAVNCAKNQGNVCMGISEAELLNYKGFSANAGLATVLNYGDAVGQIAGSVNYNLGALSKFGIDVPMGNNIEVGLFVSSEIGSNTWSYGPAVMAKIKI